MIPTHRIDCLPEETDKCTNEVSTVLNEGPLGTVFFMLYVGTHW